MSSKNNIKGFVNNMRFYFTFLVVVLYLIVGFLFLFTDVWSDLIPKARIVIGLVLMSFGLLRFYIAYKRYNTKKEKIKLLTLKSEKNVQQ
jgi:cytochrome c biogenesis protein CcdA